MRAILALEDGTWFAGQSFTGEGESGGEVIFNTGMTGYQEVLTDPSYKGQMVCMTYPLIGNYGVNEEDVESGRIQVEGFIVKECCKTPSNWRAVKSLPDYLREKGKVGIEGIDTRALTRHLRLHGAMRGYISTRDSDPAKVVEKARALPPMEGLNLVDEVTAPGPYVWDGTGMKPVELNDGKHEWAGSGPKVVAFDFGLKWNILRQLKENGFDVLAVPANFTAADVDKAAPDAVFFGPGPGDPATLTDVVNNARILLDKYPVAGICLGHQILGQALGGSTYKLKFGHHGCNHPVKDLEAGHIEISSQNHGFCVDLSGVPDVTTTHVNLNDNTLEGFRHKKKPIITVQYHPEAGPGPHDSRYFFKRFRKMLQDVCGC